MANQKKSLKILLIITSILGGFSLLLYIIYQDFKIEPKLTHHEDFKSLCILILQDKNNVYLLKEHLILNKVPLSENTYIISKTLKITFRIFKDTIKFGFSESNFNIYNTSVSFVYLKPIGISLDLETYRYLIRSIQKIQEHNEEYYNKLKQEILNFLIISNYEQRLTPELKSFLINLLNKENIQTSLKAHYMKFLNP